MQTDSPYKNALSEIKKIKPKEDDSDDFKTPVPIRKAPKLLKPQNKQRKKIDCKPTRNVEKNYVTEENFGDSDINPENLQMALALSKSTFEIQHPICQNGSEMKNSLDLTQSNKLGNVLEQFVFKSSKTRLKADKPKNTLVGVVSNWN